jgi:hypothetical protein
MKRIWALALTLVVAGCVSTFPPTVVNVVPLSQAAAVPVDSVRFVEPAPECPSVARLTVRVSTYESQKGQDALRVKAAELGANRLFVSVSDAGTETNLGTPIPMIQQSALALRCP